ncbi:LAQU0S08e02982g1_1 [Lachancea quebecensis]|uniref:LAQU0S08e02982g1_1 n=1 Tax=Lachancea quebecensis TaxID=1654605 RepID=A0A0P1KSV2_9SACH|nr:LAQU0S08e02982g1_1 [Lachancea quebecensis]
MSTQPSKLDVKAEQIRSIYGQFQSILDEKVALHLPQEQDSIKGEVLLQLQKFLVEAMDMASDSLNIVNVNERASLTELLAQSRQQFVDPFDLDLNEQVRKKYQEWEDQTVKVAQLRREAPRKLRETYENEAHLALEEADALISSFSHEPSSGQNVPDQVQDEHVELPNLVRLGEDYQEALKYLSAAKSQTPQNRAQIQKLEQLISFLESELLVGG